MRKFYAVLLLILLLPFLNAGAADKTWVGASGASWGTAANWSPSGTPTSADRAIFNTAAVVSLDVSPTVNGIWVTGSSFVSIQNPAGSKNWTFGANGTPYDGLLIDVGSTLELKTTGSTTFKLLSGFGSTAKIDGTLSTLGTASGSTAQIDFSNGGTWTINGTLKVDVFGGNPTGAGAFVGTLNFPAGSVYEVAKNGGSVPTANWDVASLIKITGSQASTVSSWSSNTAIGSLEYNCPGQTSNLTLGLPGNFIVKGNLKVVSTGVSTRLALATTLNNLTVNGNVELSAFKTSLSNSTTAAASGLSLTVLGNLLVNGGSFDLQENSSGAATLLKLAGNLTVASGASITTGSTGSSSNEIELNGSLPQTLSVLGTLGGQVRVKVNNANGTTAATNLTFPTALNSRLTLTLGNLNMGANLLSIQNPSAQGLNGGTGTSHVIGRVRRATNSTSTYVFAVGNAANSNESATVRINPAGTTATTYEVSFARPNPYTRSATGVTNVANYAWTVERVSGTENADLAFVYDQAGNNFQSGNSNAEADLRVLNWDGGAWVNPTGSGLGGIIAVPAFAFSLPSPATFTLGTVGPIPLPVNILSFSALRNGASIALQWQVGQEQNMKAYEIERSTDGRRWTTLSSVASLGNTAGQRTYNFTDNGAGAGRQLYRLLALDASGRSKYSSIVIVNGTPVRGLKLAALYPNPVSGMLTLQVESARSERVAVSLINASGAEVLRYNRQVEAGTNPLTLSTTALPAGVYTLQLQNESGERTTQKITKQ